MVDICHVEDIVVSAGQSFSREVLVEAAAAGQEVVEAAVLVVSEGEVLVAAELVGTGNEAIIIIFGEYYSFVFYTIYSCTVMIWLNVSINFSSTFAAIL